MTPEEFLNNQGYTETVSAPQGVVHPTFQRSTVTMIMQDYAASQLSEANKEIEGLKDMVEFERKSNALLVDYGKRLEQEIERLKKQIDESASISNDHVRELKDSHVKDLIDSNRAYSKLYNQHTEEIRSQQQEIERLKSLNDDVIGVLNECIEWFEYVGYNPDEYYAAKKFIQSLITPK